MAVQSRPAAAAKAVIAGVTVRAEGANPAVVFNSSWSYFTGQRTISFTQGPKEMPVTFTGTFKLVEHQRQWELLSMCHNTHTASETHQGASRPAKSPLLRSLRASCPPSLVSLPPHPTSASRWHCDTSHATSPASLRRPTFAFCQPRPSTSSRAWTSCGPKARSTHCSR